MTPNPNADQQQDEGKDNLPLNVVNNYFSFGVDAHIALEFHEARGMNLQKKNPLSKRYKPIGHFEIYRSASRKIQFSIAK